MRSRLTTVTICALLALACSEAPPADSGNAGDAANDLAQVPYVKADAPVAPSTGPAGEVAPDSRVPAGVPAGVPAAFHTYFETVPFTWGADAGLAKAKAAGKPAMLFYTSDG